MLGQSSGGQRSTTKCCSIGHGEAADSECQSTEDTESRAKRRKSNTSPNEDNGRSDIQLTLQENTCRQSYWPNYNYYY